MQISFEQFLEIHEYSPSSRAQYRQWLRYIEDAGGVESLARLIDYVLTLKSRALPRAAWNAYRAYRETMGQPIHEWPSEILLESARGATREKLGEYLPLLRKLLELAAHLHVEKLTQLGQLTKSSFRDIGRGPELVLRDGEDEHFVVLSTAGLSVWHDCIRLADPNNVKSSDDPLCTLTPIVLMAGFRFALESAAQAA